MNSSIGKYLFLVACFVFWLFLALFSSKLIVDNLTSGHEYSNFLFNLHYLKNSGAAFSLCSLPYQINSLHLDILYKSFMRGNNE